MKIISFNINSVRARLHQLKMIIDKHNPDVIGLQETKVHDDEFPTKVIGEFGYHAYYHGQKGHYGVAILSKSPSLSVTKGFATDTIDSQKRFITCVLTDDNDKEVAIMNGYFPQGESQLHPSKYELKRIFYRDLLQHLQVNYDKNQALVLMGDMNISPQNFDIGIGKNNAKAWLTPANRYCSFLDEERQWLQSVYDFGFFDSYLLNNQELLDYLQYMQVTDFKSIDSLDIKSRNSLLDTLDNIRVNNPDLLKYTWFDYRSKGFELSPSNVARRGLRIDLLLVSEILKSKVLDAGIDYEIRAMDKPSDHCPIWLTI